MSNEGGLMNISMITLGCSKNRVDSEYILGMMIASDHKIVDKMEDADVMFVNTCGFITPAKKEAIDTILQLADIKAKKNNKLIVLGCLAQRYKPELQKQLPEVDAFITLDEYQELPDVLAQHDIVVTTEYKKAHRFHSVEPWMGYLKISDGCSNSCAFCAIPLIRGKYHSFAMEDLLDQAKHMVANGVKEIVLVAQDSTLYGLDLYKKPMLVELCQQLASLESLHWIRVLYLYPDRLNEAMIDGLLSIDKVVPYFDIPLQHAHDDVLKAMNRKSTNQQMQDVIKMIKNKRTDAVIRTTMIVGYPDETQEHFNVLCDFIKQVRFDRLGAFIFYKEEDTAAYNKKDLHTNTKKKRFKELMNIQADISKQLNATWINKEVEVVVEKIDTITKTIKGRSIYQAPDDIDGYVYAKFDQELKPGDFVMVHIEKVNNYDWIGKVIAIR